MHAISLSPGNRSCSSWSYLSGGPGWEEPGAVAYGVAGDHDDQLSGDHGAVRDVLEVLDRPGRIVRRWNWVVEQSAAPDPSLVYWRPLLADDSRVTFTLVKSKDTAGNVQTEVTVRHEGLPVEWLEDLRDWWVYQLALHAHE